MVLGILRWRAGRKAIEDDFGLERPTHFLRHHRGLLPRLWEWQITRAIRAMLLEAPDRTLERCQALLAALSGARVPLLGHIDLITADDVDRIDLAIHFRTVDDICGCLVVEAKLESELSDTQLGKYQAGLRKRYSRREQRHLWVVAPTRTGRTTIALNRQQNAEWNFTSWRRLLMNWQRALPTNQTRTSCRSSARSGSV